MLQNLLKESRRRLWHAQREYVRETHALEYLFWECTLNCNFRCTHCGSRAGEKYFSDELSADVIKRAFSDIAHHYDTSKITIGVTGGEPLVRRDLFPIMHYASTLGFRWGMVSNGSLVTPEIVQLAKEAGMTSVDISIDGIGKIHDSFRNMAGAYDKALNAVRLYANANFLQPLRITTTIHKQNIDSMDKMYDIFLNSGAQEWRLLPIDPIGRAAINKHLLLDKQDMTKLLHFIKNKREQNKSFNISSACTHFFGPFEEKVRKHPFFCATGINVGSILHNGDIFVCPNVPRTPTLIQGNITRDHFPDVWEEKYTYFRDPDRTANRSCRQCPHWDDCRGGAFHTWDYPKSQQKVCYMRNDLYK